MALDGTRNRSMGKRHKSRMKWCQGTPIDLVFPRVSWVDQELSSKRDMLGLQSIAIRTKQ